MTENKKEMEKMGNKKRNRQTAGGESSSGQRAQGKGGCLLLRIPSLSFLDFFPMP